MTFENKIRYLNERYLANVRVPDITGFVDQLFNVEAETGMVACTFHGDKTLRFFSRSKQSPSKGLLPLPTQRVPTCLVEHDAARSVLRMICARLGVICKDRTTSETSPYGHQMLLDYDAQNRKRWSISFINTPDRQEFLIEAV
jgi:hypothetical protein